jgi:hypothetical protein
MLRYLLCPVVYLTRHSQNSRHLINYLIDSKTGSKIPCCAIPKGHCRCRLPERTLSKKCSVKSYSSPKKTVRKPIAGLNRVNFFLSSSFFFLVVALVSHFFGNFPWAPSITGVTRWPEAEKSVSC